MRLSPEINMPFFVEIAFRRAEVRSQNSEIRSQKSEVRRVLPHRLALAIPYRMRLLTPAF